jgi:hypothetical protein
MAASFHRGSESMISPSISKITVFNSMVTNILTSCDAKRG